MLCTCKMPSCIQGSSALGLLQGKNAPQMLWPGLENVSLVKSMTRMTLLMRRRKGSFKSIFQEASCAGRSSPSPHTVKRRLDWPCVYCVLSFHPQAWSGHQPTFNSSFSFSSGSPFWVRTITPALSEHPTGPSMDVKGGEDNPDTPGCMLRAGPPLMSLARGAIISSAPGKEPSPQQERARVTHKVRGMALSSWNPYLTQKPSAPDAINRAGPSSPGSHRS